MKTVLVIAILCLYSFPLAAASDVSSDFTSGSNGYRGNQIQLDIPLTELWNLWFGFGFVKSKSDRPVSTSGSTGISLNAAEGFNLRGSYLFSPKVEGFSSRSWSIGFTLGTDTTFGLDYGRTGDQYDIQTGTSSVTYINRRGRRVTVFIPAQNFTETIQQTKISLQLAHTFLQGTSVYIGFSDYNYEPDIEDTIRLVNVRQSNYALFNLVPGLSGYPTVSFGAGIYYPFFTKFGLNFDCLRMTLVTFSYNNNKTLILLDDYYEPNELSANSYTYGLSYQQNQEFSYRLNYNLYKESGIETQKFLTLGLTYSF